MYRKCTVDLVPKGVFRPPNAIGVNGEKQGYPGTKKPPKLLETPRVLKWLREPDLNRRPSGYEPALLGIVSVWQLHTCEFHKFPVPEIVPHEMVVRLSVRLAVPEVFPKLT